MEKFKTEIKKVKLKNLLSTGLFLLTITLPMLGHAATGNLESFQGVKGLEDFIGDVESFLLIVAPIAAICCSVYFAIRRSAADEQEGKMWTKRIITAWVGCAIALLSSGILELLKKYIGA